MQFQNECYASSCVCDWRTHQILSIIYTTLAGKWVCADFVRFLLSSSLGWEIILLQNLRFVCTLKIQSIIVYIFYVLVFVCRTSSHIPWTLPLSLADEHFYSCEERRKEIDRWKYQKLEEWHTICSESKRKSALLRRVLAMNAKLHDWLFKFQLYKS